MSLKGKVSLFNIFSFFNSLDFYIPIKIVYFHTITGSYSSASTIISVVWVSQALLEIPTGIFSDIIGRKQTIILGSLFACLGYGLYAESHIYWLLLFGSILEGASRSFFSGNNNAYLHNVLADEKMEHEYHHFYGKLNSIIGVAMFVAALLSGFLASWSIHLFMWINLIPQVISLIFSFMLTDTTHGERTHTNILIHLKEAIIEIKENVNIRYLSLSQILGGSGLAAYEYQAAVFGAVLPIWAVGIARAVQEGGVIPSFYWAGKIIDRLGYVKVLAVSWLTATLGNILAALAQSSLSPLLIMISLPLYGAGDTAQQHLLQEEFTEIQRATIASLNSFGNSITFSIALYLCGLIANRYGPFMALLATQVFLIPSDIYKVKFLRKIHKPNSK